MTESAATTLIPVLTVRDTVIFPHMVVPLFIGRKVSKRVIEKAIDSDCDIFCVTQRDAAKEHPSLEDLYQMGAVTKIRQVIKLPDGCFKILIEGICRARLLELNNDDVYKRALIGTRIEDVQANQGPLSKVVMNRFTEYAKLTETLSAEVISALASIRHTGRLCDLITMNIPVETQRKQSVLDTVDLEKRVETVVSILQQEIEWKQIDERIHNRVKKSISKDQENYFKNQKLKAIQQELGEEDFDNSLVEADKFKEKLEKTGISAVNKDKVLAEINRLKMMPPMSAESTVIRAYIEWVLDLPWKKRAKVNTDLKKARKILDLEHYGLDDVKERVIESIAVNKRVKIMRGPILCLVGPPGVGKTSLGQSIAKATGRPFVRISLGGVRDESEIRGHRKTYIGAMPGRIIKAMKRANVVNPLIMLDEIDKLGSDFRGDPASALLEVLDPEQNSKFTDHYLEIDYDLSDVLFVTTSNSLDISPPLLDRMEVIRLSGYTEKEKLHIASEHLLEKNFSRVGLEPTELRLGASVIPVVIKNYTREAGVRELDRCINKICRKALRAIVEQDEKNKKNITISAKSLQKYLGPVRHQHNMKFSSDHIGKIQGLAWTSVGGELLTIESVIYPGKGKYVYTGSLGDVMKESIQTALSIVKLEAKNHNISSKFFETRDIHIHVPEGATPKDGPSAGIGMTSVILSAVTGKKIKADVALTGEVTLTGDVLAIGGLKEKLLAALRSNIHTVIIPEANKKDLSDLPVEVKKAISIHTVKRIEAVFPLVICDYSLEEGQ